MSQRPTYQVGWLDYPDYVESLPSCTVLDPENGPTYTGLLDHNGVKIYRMPEPRRIGFISSR